MLLMLAPTLSMKLEDNNLDDYHEDADGAVDLQLEQVTETPAVMETEDMMLQDMTEAEEDAEVELESERCRCRRCRGRRCRCNWRARYTARLNAKYKAIMDKYKGTKAYEVMKKCGGSDYRLTWAEVKTCL